MVLAKMSTRTILSVSLLLSYAVVGWKTTYIIAAKDAVHRHLYHTQQQQQKKRCTSDNCANTAHTSPFINQLEIAFKHQTKMVQIYGPGLCVSCMFSYSGWEAMMWRWHCLSGCGCGCVCMLITYIAATAERQNEHHYRCVWCVVCASSSYNTI